MPTPVMTNYYPFFACDKIDKTLRVRVLAALIGETDELVMVQNISQEVNKLYDWMLYHAGKKCSGQYKGIPNKKEYSGSVQVSTQKLCLYLRALVASIAKTEVDVEAIDLDDEDVPDRTRDDVGVFDASSARRIVIENATDLNSPAIKQAISIIERRIQERAQEGRTELIYPFDSIQSDGRLYVGAGSGPKGPLTDVQKSAIKDVLTKRGFKYSYAPTQDAGSPMDRPYVSFSW